MTPHEEIVKELESISYDLFAKVSARMWWNRRAKDEIRTLQDRIDEVKWHVIGTAIVPTPSKETS